MNSIILCEGFDDIFFVGYYLFKTNTWTIEKNRKISDLYDFPDIKHRNQAIEVYGKGDNTISIWCVGGKDSYEQSFKFMQKINEQFPQEGFQQVFLLCDRDNSEIEDCLTIIEETMKKYGLAVGKLNNNVPNQFQYEVEGDIYNFCVIPIIIPFDETGALETVLLKAIEETGEVDSFIVHEGKKYIDGLLNMGVQKKYLKHDRLVLKAKFSSVISVTNPDRSTALFNALLMSNPWEEKESIKEHFGIFDRLL